jgi:hypothetical protein
LTRRGKTLLAALLVLCALVSGWKILSRSVEDARPATESAPRAAPTEALPVLELPAHEARSEGLAPAEAAVADAAPAAEPPAAMPWEVPGAKKVKLTGRVLLPDGRTPAAGVQVNLDDAHFKSFDDDTQTTDAEGHFVFEPDPGRPFDSAQLMAMTTDESAWALKGGIAFAATEDADLGDIVLEPVRSLQLSLADPGGRPVVGARAAAVEEERMISDGSDADGQITLAPIPQNVHVLHVWALGFATASFELPDPLPAAPIKLVLQPCPLLTLRIVGANGGSAEGFTVQLKAAETPFATVVPGEYPGQVRIEHAAEKVGLSAPVAIFQERGAGTTAAPVVCLFHPEGREPIVLGDLRPGVELELTLTDNGGAAAWGPTKLTLADGERRELELRPTVQTRRVLVLVRDPSGQPVPSAWVDLAAAGNSLGNDRSTDANGLATFENVVAARGEIGIQCAPWARAVLHDVDFLPDTPIEATLSPGLTAKILLVDEAGRPTKAERIFVAVDGHHFPSFSTTREDPPPASEFELDGLPAGPVQLGILHGQDFAHRDIDARQGTVTVSVPWSDAAAGPP